MHPGISIDKEGLAGLTYTDLVEEGLERIVVVWLQESLRMLQ